MQIQANDPELTWGPLYHTTFRLLVKKIAVEFLSNELKSVEKQCFSLSQSTVAGVSLTSGCLPYLRCEEPLYPTGQEGLVEDAAD